MDRPGGGWAFRRTPADPPAALVEAVRRWPAPEIVGALLWARGVEAPEDALRFLEPTLANGLRPPETLPGLRLAGERLRAVAAGDAGLVVEAAAGAAPLLGACVLGGWLAAVGRRVRVASAAAAPALPPRHAIHVRADGVEVAGAWAGSDAMDPPLAPAGMAFYACAAARAARRAAGEDPGPDLRTLLDLVALGTVIAGCRLTAENRVLVAAGLRRWRARARPGLRALAETASIAVPSSALVRERLGPRLEGALAGGAGDAVVALIDARDPEEAHAAAVRVELAAASARTPDAAARGAVSGVVLVDAEMPLDRLTPGLLLALARLEPHGCGNPEPVFLARDVRVDGVRFGGDPMRPWWRLRLRQGGRTRTATAARAAAAPPAPGTHVDVAYVPRLASDGERRAVELAVRGLWPRGEAEISRDPGQ